MNHNSGIIIHCCQQYFIMLIYALHTHTAELQNMNENSPISSINSEESLYKVTRQLLQCSEEGVWEISTKTGLGYFWLRQLKAGNIVDPGVNKIQKLYEYLTKKKLELHG